MRPPRLSHPSEDISIPPFTLLELFGRPFSNDLTFRDESLPNIAKELVWGFCLLSTGDLACPMCPKHKQGVSPYVVLATIEPSQEGTEVYDSDRRVLTSAEFDTYYSDRYHRIGGPCL